MNNLMFKVFVVYFQANNSSNMFSALNPNVGCFLVGCVPSGFRVVRRCDSAHLRASIMTSGYYVEPQQSEPVKSKPTLW